MDRLDTLLAAGLVKPEQEAAVGEVMARHAVSIPPQIADLIKAERGDGPLSKQFLPTAAELAVAEDEDADPTGDLRHSPAPGLIHRYPDRVVLQATTVCAVYCRFCFRKEVVGPPARRHGKRGKDATLTHASRLDLTAALAYIRADARIREVILSGGDPLMLRAEKLSELLRRLAAIPHVHVLRLHTRIPVVDSARVDAALLDALRVGKTVYVVIHCNHPSEISDAARAACARLVDSGVPLLSQSVLLKGVNDDFDTLKTLFQSLVANRVKPYYLHHLDRAPGTAHFRVPLEAGRALMARLRANLSGLCMPEYILEIPGGHGKAPVGPAYLRRGANEGEYTVLDHQGDAHAYTDAVACADADKGA